ncbi:MAG: hypothetical protein QXP36_07060 [Conexivisphaerales archaeon]
MWSKMGMIPMEFGKKEWMVSHAYIPTPLVQKDNVRVYVAFWDKNKVGRIGYVDLDPEKNFKVTSISERPVLDTGIPGTFDDNGVSPTSLISVANKLYLYYFGWQLGVRIRYTLYMGLAISDDGGETFERIKPTPILERTPEELFIRSGGAVIRDEGKYKMWYAGGSEWRNIRGKMVPSYSLRYIESENGVAWANKSKVCLVPLENEIGFGRPAVLKEEGKYKMWYSIRSINNSYTIGYGESKDGIRWDRIDGQFGLQPSESGWDSEMTAYAAVFEYGGKRYMLYNGNNFGAEGFGLAVWK